MSFSLTDEQSMIQSAARDFAMNEVLPIANEYDPERRDIPQSLLAKLSEMGFFGITIPQEYGGLGLGCLEYCLVTEELSRAWMSVSSIIRPMLGYQAMTEAQKRTYLPKMATGEMLFAFSMSEPGTGSDISGLSTRAERDGDDWLITGNKYWCTNADGSDAILVLARTESVDKAKPHQGISAFVVEKPRGELPQGCAGAPIPKIGYFGWKTWELALDQCRVPHANMVSEPGRAFYLATSGLEVARAHTAARAIGLARGGLEDAMRYALERVQFGRPIGEFQAIRFKIAQMATDIEAARQLLYSVCSKIDTGVRCDVEAAMVKLFATEMAERVTSEALQIHGGAGYTTHHAVERYWRDARLTKIFEGTSEIQLRVISDRLLGKPAA
ncbi:alkylation response protein AidB-like acyl-CoA dehydrogenase [Sphingopyxis panaciterrae]|uniref:acyl-CoA dehydrogenase family protein n=1 Tax=Sphingopyxis panaciterrae TaxID=363841 RepID=UPI00142328F5|nr:acyl-CoA dehydrogenase family protein [Sphingopyxis panaciterrae]NIJ37592.1 alkylation response protein AidB-like acyl-CoA dehydrogenase [Sphingopyxis panaciterrae]